MPVVARIEVPPPEPFVEGEGGAEAHGAGYRFIAPRTATEPLVMEAADGSVFLWTPTELCYRDEFGQIEFIAGSAPVQLEVRGREARYRRTFPASDEVHIAQPEGRKYWLVLHERPRDPASYLQGEIWFGVSGMVGGVPLPPGIHRTMESFGFQFKAPFAADLMDAQTECWYEVVDTENGQMLFIWCRADWLLAEDRVYPVKVDPTVIVIGQYGATYKVGRFSDGTWVVCYTTAESSELRCVLSLDNFESVTAPITVMSNFEGGWDMAVSGEYLWLAYRSRTPNVWAIRRGTLTATKDGITWETIWSKSTDSTARDQLSLAVSPKPDGDGFVCVFSPVQVLPLSTVRHCAIVVDVGADGIGRELSTIYYEHTDNFVIRGSCVVSDGAGQFMFVSLRYGSGIRTRFGRFENGSITWGPTILYSADLSGVVSLDAIWAPTGKWYIALNQWWLEYTPQSSDWTAIFELPSYSLRPTLSTDRDGNVYLFYPSTGYGSSLLMRKWDGIALSEEVICGEDRGVSSPTALRSGTDMIAVLYTQDYISPRTVNVFLLPLNEPPFAPSNLTCTPFDATEDAVFTWQYNDPDPNDNQSTYHLQIRLAGSDTDLVDTGEVQSPHSEHLLPGGTLENGKVYQWRVRTADQAGEWSPWSNYAVFQTGPKPVATILYPTAGATVSTSEVTVEWSVPSQSSATVRLYDGAGQTVLQEHEVTTPSARQRTITGLENNQSYQVSVQPVSAIGVVGDEVFSGPFDVAYTPPPKPTATAAGQAGFIRVTITNPAPAEGEPEVTHNDLYRRGPGSSWVRIATGIAPDGTYYDYAVGSGVVYEYRARAVAANGTYTDSDPVQATVIFDEWRFSPIDGRPEIRFRFDSSVTWRPEEDVQVPRTMSRYRRAYRNPAYPRVATIQARFRDGEDGLTVREQRERLLQYIEQGVVGWLRGPHGDCWRGVLLEPEVLPSSHFARETVTCAFRETREAP